MRSKSILYGIIIIIIVGSSCTGFYFLGYDISQKKSNSSDSDLNIPIMLSLTENITEQYNEPTVSFLAIISSDTENLTVFSYFIYHEENETSYIFRISANKGYIHYFSISLIFNDAQMVIVHSIIAKIYHTPSSTSGTIYIGSETNYSSNILGISLLSYSQDILDLSEYEKIHFIVWVELISF